MSPLRTTARAAAAALVLLAPLAAAAPAHAAPSYKNCTEYQKSFPHGVGLRTAVDKTSGKPVTTFKKDDAEFKRAMAKNRGLDRDGDKIACEKR